MDDGFKNLENLVPSCERIGQSKPFQIGASSSEAVVRRLRLDVPTGMVSTSNERLGQHGSSLFYNTRCVGSSYQILAGKKWIDWKSSFSQMLLNLEAPDTVVSFCQLSVPLVIAVSTLYVGFTFKLQWNPDVGPIVKTASKFLTDNNATASIVAFDDQRRVSALSYIFKGHLYGNFRAENDELVPTDAELWDKISSESQLRLNAFILSQENLKGGYGIDLLTPDDEGGGSKVGARKRPHIPSGDTSIALE